MCKHKCKKSLFFGKEQASRRDARGTRDHSCLWNGLVAHRSNFFISQPSGILTRIHKQCLLNLKPHRMFRNLSSLILAKTKQIDKKMVTWLTNSLNKGHCFACNLRTWLYFLRFEFYWILSIKIQTSWPTCTASFLWSRKYLKAIEQCWSYLATITNTANLELLTVQPQITMLHKFIVPWALLVFPSHSSLTVFKTTP